MTIKTIIVIHFHLFHIIFHLNFYFSIYLCHRNYHALHKGTIT